MSNTLIPNIATHPGEVLKDELNARDIKQKDFAAQISMQPTMLNEIINGKRPITADIAILFEKALDIPANFWMNFQVQYELDNARIKERNIQKLQLIEQWQLIQQYVPLKYFSKFGYLTNNVSEDIVKVKQIYQVNRIDELVDSFASFKSLTPSYYRKSDKLQIDEVNMFGWSSLVMWRAKTEKGKAFDPNKLVELKNGLHSIFFRNLNSRELTKELLSEFGIKLIFQGKFEKTPVDGFSFWSEENPAIGLTLRHSRIDNFAFTIFHELGHIYHHLQKDKSSQFMDLEKTDNSLKSKIEKEADSFAQTNLIDEEQWNELISMVPLNENTLIAFSKKHKINPAIVLGRVCFEMKNYAIKTSIDKSLN